MLIPLTTMNGKRAIDKANEVQSDASLEGINFLQTAAPGIFAAIAIIIVYFYNLEDKKLEHIQTELADRNK